MKTRLAAALLVLIWTATPLFAHRLDEYLQATTIDLQKGRVVLTLRLTPGVQVLPTVLASIDTDKDGTLSAAEERAYADRVLEDLTLTVDGKSLPLRLVSSTFPTLDLMKEGVGVIVLSLEAPVPRGGSSRTLVFENRHQRAISVYLANCLFPSYSDIRITRQTRNYEQSVYRVNYTQAGVAPEPAAAVSGSGIRRWLVADGVVLLASVVLLYWRRRTSAVNGSVAHRVSSHAS